MTAAATTSLLEDEEFVRDEIQPFASGSRSTPPTRSEVTLTVHRRRGDGRLVVEYDFGRSMRVFAKLYPERAAGAAAFRIHESLWHAGLGEASAHRVPEPLGYLSEHGVLLLAPASGAQVGNDPLPRGLAGVRRAARWLAFLHSRRIDLDTSDAECLGALRLARRAATATAVRPELEGVVRGLLELLAERYPRARAPDEHVPTHGRFSLEHVFSAPRHVTAVDLDRVAIADPAKDVGELLHRLRWRAGRHSGVPDAVDAACAAFVHEYRRRSRSSLVSLEYHWSLGVVWTLLVLASKHRPGKGWDERSGILLAELDGIPRRAAGLLASP